ncbi:hypothetical protein [Desulfovibrio inopinatus]|uniref:hypothetical protein n=1 Tax=Desulfovibrio inopinatus TaxID=102109 RepID=UPI0003FD4238|nr:hypothetical protein [Desulfovibrio inopinatus]
MTLCHFPATYRPFLAILRYISSRLPGAMKYVLLAGTLALVFVSKPAFAFNEELLISCALREALAMITCKPKSEFNYMGIRDGIYIYNAYYGAEYTEFYCQRYGNNVVISSRAWQGKRSAARLVIDYPSGCVIATVDKPQCSVISEAKCCGAVPAPPPPPDLDMLPGS